MHLKKDCVSYLYSVTQITCPWDLKRLRIILNPYDATSGMKLTNNGLEVVKRKIPDVKP